MVILNIIIWEDKGSHTDIKTQLFCGCYVVVVIEDVVFLVVVMVVIVGALLFVLPSGLCGLGWVGWYTMTFFLCQTKLQLGLELCLG